MFFLKLVPGDAYRVGIPSGAGITIEDDDTALPVVTVSAHDATAGEPGNPGRFVLTSSQSLYGKTLHFTVSGTATAGVDFEPIAPSIRVTDIINDNAVQIRVPPLDDAVREAVETVTLTLVPGPDNAVGTPNSATVQIADDESEG